MLSFEQAYCITQRINICGIKQAKQSKGELLTNSPRFAFKCRREFKGREGSIFSFSPNRINRKEWHNKIYWQQKGPEDRVIKIQQQRTVIFYEGFRQNVIKFLLIWLIHLLVLNNHHHVNILMSSPCHHHHDRFHHPHVIKMSLSYHHNVIIIIM